MILIKTHKWDYESSSYPVLLHGSDYIIPCIPKWFSSGYCKCKACKYICLHYCPICFEYKSCTFRETCIKMGDEYYYELTSNLKSMCILDYKEINSIKLFHKINNCQQMEVLCTLQSI